MLLLHTFSLLCDKEPDNNAERILLDLDSDPDDDELTTGRFIYNTLMNLASLVLHIMLFSQPSILLQSRYTSHG